MNTVLVALILAVSTLHGHGSAHWQHRTVTLLRQLQALDTAYDTGTDACTVAKSAERAYRQLTRVELPPRYRHGQRMMRLAAYHQWSGLEIVCAGQQGRTPDTVTIGLDYLQLAHDEYAVTPRELQEGV